MDKKIKKHTRSITHGGSIIRPTGISSTKSCQELTVEPNVLSWSESMGTVERISTYGETTTRPRGISLTRSRQELKVDPKVLTWCKSMDTVEQKATCGETSH